MKRFLLFYEHGGVELLTQYNWKTSRPVLDLLKPAEGVTDYFFSSLLK